MAKHLDTVTASDTSNFGELSITEFFERYWQQRPLFVRRALPDLAQGNTPCSVEDLLNLAGRQELRSRVIQRKHAQWEVKHGPFSESSPLPSRKLPNWTVLVQGVDQHHRGVRALLNQFRFVPDARLDDVMISFATNGGGVGAHADSYDVFLVQAFGKRQWKLQAPQRKESLIPDQPLKLLAGFKAETEAVLEPGDMLYVPPGWGHDGVAIGECMTYSVGFRAAEKKQLQQSWLDALADTMQEDDEATVLYRDVAKSLHPAPGKSPTPAKLPPAMLDELRRWLVEALTTGPARQSQEQQQFLGRWLSAPRTDATFKPASKLPSLGPWWTKAAKQGIELSLSSRMLYDELAVYLNGESVRCSGADKRWLELLANQRFLSNEQCQSLAIQKFEALRDQLHAWADEGWLALRQ